MTLSRREIIGIFGASAAATWLRPVTDVAMERSAEGPVRMKLEEFVESRQLLAGLRRAVRAMQKRKPSDPLSWFYQAAIHGVSDDLLKKAEDEDSTVGNVFQKRYWKQCPHYGENSANFLPWHRAYTYHFETIVRMHSELDDFALPYWNYSAPDKPDNRKFPKVFGIQHLDGDRNNDADENINPLYIAERSFYFAGYEHPLTDQLPLLRLSEGAVDESFALSADVFFGTTEREGLGGGIGDESRSTRGRLESAPHDQIHRAVGGVIGATTGDPTVGYMANPPTAAFDPIFCVHHTNMDRLWAKWSCMPGKRWGELPSEYWFNERPWYFIDDQGKVVNRPRKDYFDYRALGVRFDDEDLSCTPLALPTEFALTERQETRQVSSFEELATSSQKFGVLPSGRTVAPLSNVSRNSLRNSDRVKAALNADNVDQRIVLRLLDVRLGLTEATAFNVFVTDEPGGELTRKHPGFVGTLTLFGHSHSGDEHRSPAFQQGSTESFDITNALAALAPKRRENLSVVILPFSLFELGNQQSPSVILERELVTVGGMQFLNVGLIIR